MQVLCLACHQEYDLDRRSLTEKRLAKQWPMSAVEGSRSLWRTFFSSVGTPSVSGRPSRRGLVPWSCVLTSGVACLRCMLGGMPRCLAVDTGGKLLPPPSCFCRGHYGMRGMPGFFARSLPCYPSSSLILGPRQSCG